MSAPDECCWRCVNCGHLTCTDRFCANGDEWADPEARLCGVCDDAGECA